MRKLALLLVIPVICTLGCASKESKLLGTWAPDGADSAKPSLDLKADHKFSMSGKGDAAGTWKLQESKVQLTIETVNGTSVSDFISKLPAQYAAKAKEQIAKPIEGTVADDLKSITISQNGQSAVLKKKA